MRPNFGLENAPRRARIVGKEDDRVKHGDVASFEGKQGSCIGLRLSFAHSAVSVEDLTLVSRHHTALLSYSEIFSVASSPVMLLRPVH